MPREWDYYTSSNGRDPVEKALQKANPSKYEAGRLDQAMKDRAAGLGRAGIDFKHLRDGVWELRVDGHNRTFRLFYGEPDGVPVLLALHFIVKKRQVDHIAVDRAVRRLREWNRRTR